MAEAAPQPEPQSEKPVLTEEELAKKAEKEKKKAQKKEEQKDKDQWRVITTMYRAASRNHVAFVAIGDRRASILIGTCTLMISVTFTIFLRGSTEPTLFLIPGVILILTCTATMILAMLSTRPFNARGFYTMEDIVTQPANLLFFENYYKMDIRDYEAAMDKMIKNDTRMRHAMVRDLHGLGVSVARKYKFLRVSYDVLMFGVILAVLTLFGAMFWTF